MRKRGIPQRYRVTIHGYIDKRIKYYYFSSFEEARDFATSIIVSEYSKRKVFDRKLKRHFFVK